MLSKSLFSRQIRSFSSSSARLVSVGDKIPSITLFHNSPGNQVNLAEETSQGKSVVIGVPGAFSPACSASHVPGYISHLKQFANNGYDKLFVVAVNDAFVQKAWADSLLKGTDGADKITFLADPKGEFTEALDLKFDATKFFGNERSKRYALLVDGGKVSGAFVEPDNVSVDVSSAEKVAQHL